MDTVPSKRAGLPHHELYANVDRYRELHSTAFHYEFHLLRHDCRRHLGGRPCCASDYPFPQLLGFTTCSQRPLRDAKARLPPPAMRDPNDARHHLSFPAVEVLVEAGVVDLYKDRQPISQALKQWVKQNDNLLSPSAEQVKMLALRSLPANANNAAYDERANAIDRWFSDKRMQRYLKFEEQQAALRNESTQEHTRAIALRLLHAASSKVAGVAAPFTGVEAVLLLSDSRIDLSPLGTLKVLLERIYENREHIIRMLGLDASQIERIPTAAEAAADADDDPLLCAVCNGDATPQAPILKCDGDHNTEVGYHLRCLPEEYRRDEMPPDDQAWLCPECMDSDLYILEAVLDKKVQPLRQAGGRCGKRVVHYQCRWMGYGPEGDTWEPLCNIPKKECDPRGLVSEFNKSLRKEVQASASQSSATSNKKAKATSGGDKK